MGDKYKTLREEYREYERYRDDEDELQPPVFVNVIEKSGVGCTGIYPDKPFDPKYLNKVVRVSDGSSTYTCRELKE